MVNLLVNMIQFKTDLFLFNLKSVKMYNFLRIRIADAGFSVADTLEFFLNRAELSLNPVNSGNLKIIEA